MLIEQLKQAKHWEDRYRLLIQAGKQIEKPDANELAQWTEIQGCEAGLWVKISLTQEQSGICNRPLQAYSEARIINGLLKLLMDELKGKTISQIQTFNFTEFFDALGITQRLSSTRLNGLKQIEKLLQK